MAKPGLVIFDCDGVWSGKSQPLVGRALSPQQNVRQPFQLLKKSSLAMGSHKFVCRSKRTRRIEISLASRARRPGPRLPSSVRASDRNVLSTVGIFTGQDFVVALLTLAFVAATVAKATRSRGCACVAVAYLTFLVPGLGPIFGASGLEHLYIWPALGLAGGLVWSIPFAILRLTGR